MKQVIFFLFLLVSVLCSVYVIPRLTDAPVAVMAWFPFLGLLLLHHVFSSRAAERWMWTAGFLLDVMSMPALTFHLAQLGSAWIALRIVDEAALAIQKPVRIFASLTATGAVFYSVGSLLHLMQGT